MNFVKKALSVALILTMCNQSQAMLRKAVASIACAVPAARVVAARPATAARAVRRAYAATTPLARPASMKRAMLAAGFVAPFAFAGLKSAKAEGQTGDNSQVRVAFDADLSKVLPASIAPLGRVAGQVSIPLPFEKLLEEVSIPSPEEVARRSFNSMPERVASSEGQVSLRPEQASVRMDISLQPQKEVAQPIVYASYPQYVPVNPEVGIQAAQALLIDLDGSCTQLADQHTKCVTAAMNARDIVSGYYDRDLERDTVACKANHDQALGAIQSIMALHLKSAGVSINSHKSLLHTLDKSFAQQARKYATCIGRATEARDYVSGYYDNELNRDSNNCRANYSSVVRSIQALMAAQASR